MKDYKRIYLVDDNETSNFLNQDVVEDGFPTAEVLVFSNSQEFIDHCFSNRELFNTTSLLLLDINMPGKFGFEVLEELEEEVEDMENMDVLMVTSSNLKRDLEASQRFDSVMGYVEKPLSLQKLETSLKGLNA